MSNFDIRAKPNKMCSVSKRVKPLTIIVGAICNNGKQVIVAADRMLTQEHLSVEFETQERKIEEITKSCVVMSAGDALVQHEVLQPAKVVIKSSAISQIPQVVEKIKESFVKERNKRFEEANLKPRGLTLENFYGGAQRALEPTIAMRLDRQLEEAEIELQIIIAGVDQTGAHLYCLVDPGVSQCFNPLGFCGFGSGYPHAMLVFISNSYDVGLNVKKAVYFVYEAKRRSEAAPGVGREYTDLAIIDKNIYYLNQSELNQLKEIYDTKIRLEKPKEIEDMINNLKFKAGKET